MVIIKFLGSTAGRWVRGIIGAALLTVGAVQGGYWWILAAVGLIVAAAGILDVCLLAPPGTQAPQRTEVPGVVRRLSPSGSARERWGRGRPFDFPE